MSLCIFAWLDIIFPVATCLYLQAQAVLRAAQVVLLHPLQDSKTFLLLPISPFQADRYDQQYSSFEDIHLGSSSTNDNQIVCTIQQKRVLN